VAVITEQLLSYLGVDLAELDIYAGGRYCVIQRDPQPLETDIAIGTALRLLIVDLEGEPGAGGGGGGGGFGHAPFGHFPFGHSPAPPPAGTIDFDLYCEGTLILQYISGVASWPSVFTGTVEVSAPDAPYIFLRVEALQPGSPIFVSEQEVTVRVVVNPSAPYLDTSYAFTIQDLTPPNIITAMAIDELTTRIEFDDEMAVDGAGSALDPANYSIVTLNQDPEPGVSLEVESVAEVPGSGSRMFDLRFQWEQTPGCEYRIEVAAAVTDSSGNHIA